MLIVAHAIGDDGRHQRFNRAQHRHGNRRPEQTVNQVGVKFGNGKVRQPAGYSVKTASDGFHRNFENNHRGRSKQQRNNRAGNAIGYQPADDQDCHSSEGESRCQVVQRLEMGRQRFHPQPKHTGSFVDLQAEEILHLRARDQDGNAVREADHDRSRDELHGRSHSGHAHEYEENAGHHRTHEQSVHAMRRDDARDDDDERTRWTADLCF